LVVAQVVLPYFDLIETVNGQFAPFVSKFSKMIFLHSRDVDPFFVDWFDGVFRLVKPHQDVNTQNSPVILSLERGPNLFTTN
jgi:hypothetical protein